MIEWLPIVRHPVVRLWRACDACTRRFSWPQSEFVDIQIKGHEKVERRKCSHCGFVCELLLAIGVDFGREECQT